MVARAPALSNQPILLDPERVGHLEGFDRRVSRVRHVGVDAGHPGPERESALSPRDGFVVRERPRAPTADRQVIHGPLALRRNAVDQRLRHREEQDIDDALRRLNVSRGNRGRTARTDETPFFCDHLDGTVRARIAGCGRVREAPHDIVRGAQGHRKGRVEVSADLAVRPGEVHRDAGSSDRDLRANPDELRLFR